MDFYDRDHLMGNSYIYIYGSLFSFLLDSLYIGVSLLIFLDAQVALGFTDLRDVVMFLGMMTGTAGMGNQKI